MRRSAKWAFVFLALVFAGSFVFLGVGSGNSGLGDVFQNIFRSGSSGPSAESIRKKISESPRSADLYRQLGEALARDGKVAEAIDAYKTYVALRPRSLDGLNQLAALYEQQARVQTEEAQVALARQQQLAPTGFGPAPSSKLGKALAAYPDPIQRAVSSGTGEGYAEALSKLGETRRAALDVYRRIARLSPDEPSAQLQVAIAAEQAGQPETALAAYETFVARFPDDPSVATAKQRIKELKKEIGGAKSS